ncbi:MAG: hypothetical protein JXX28_02905 [Deltaproteobacteria bacterium]|nr:hypothetical protein [Deltaproteobacteria bacterium]
MARWSEVHNFLLTKFEVAGEEDGHTSLVWSWRDGRKQKIQVSYRDAFGRGLLHIRSSFAHEDEVDAIALLRMNRELPFATVALMGDTWYVVYNALIQNMALDEVEFCMARVAAVADTLEEQFLGRDEH